MNFAKRVGNKKSLFTDAHLAQSAGAAEFTDFISAEEFDTDDKSVIYDTKQSDGEAPLMLEL